MLKDIFFFFWAIIFPIMLLLSFAMQGTDCTGPTIDNGALFIHTELSVDVKSREEIIATVTMRNDTMFPYWLFPAVIPSNHPAMPVFDILYGEGHDVKYTGAMTGNFVRWSRRFPHPAPTYTEEWIVLQPGESRSWSCNLAKQYDFDALLDRGVDSFKVGYLADNPYWPNGLYAEFPDSPLHWTKPMYHILGFTWVPGTTSEITEWRYIRVPR